MLKKLIARSILIFAAIGMLASIAFAVSEITGLAPHEAGAVVFLFAIIIAAVAWSLGNAE